MLVKWCTLKTKIFCPFPVTAVVAKMKIQRCYGEITVTNR